MFAVREAGGTDGADGVVQVEKPFLRHLHGQRIRARAQKYKERKSNSVYLEFRKISVNYYDTLYTTSSSVSTVNFFMYHFVFCIIIMMIIYNNM